MRIERYERSGLFETFSAIKARAKILAFLTVRKGKRTVDSFFGAVEKEFFALEVFLVELGFALKEPNPTSVKKTIEVVQGGQGGINASRPPAG